jgi:hypothetical protein
MRSLRVGAAVVMLGLVPGQARAQVYPDRVALKEKVRAIVATYQGRTRDDNRAEQTERTTRTLRIGSSGSIDLGNIAGDIAVTRGGGSEATVEIVKTARGRDAADAKDMLALVTVDVTERNGRAEVTAHYPGGDDQRRTNRRNVNVSVAYNVTAPAGTRISIQSISGSIRITDIKGDVSANTISGDVHISGAGRVSTAKSISGTIEIEDMKTDGGLDASTVSGDVRLRRVSARRLSGGTVSGNVRLEDVQADTVGAHSTSGTITFAGALARNGRYELKSFSGEVRLTLAGNTGFEINANSFSGGVRSDFPITTHGTVDTSGRHPHRTVLKGTYGDGSAVLDLTTFSGSIVIAKR